MPSFETQSAARGPRNTRILILAAAVLSAVAGTLFAGPYAGATSGINYNDPRIAGWATGAAVTWPAGWTPSYNDPDNALGPVVPNAGDYAVVTLGDCGTAVLTFGRTISNGPGPDLAVFENGFSEPAYPGKLFAELAYVEVSTDGDNYARFPSVSLNAWPGDRATLDPTNVYNLAGKTVNNDQNQIWRGTPFDLSDLTSSAFVLSGAVKLNDIQYVRIVDVYGHTDGSSVDEATSLIDPATGLNYTKNHRIYDGGNFGAEFTGFDLDAVAVVKAVIGDANGDGNVDGGDLAIWQQHYDPLGLNKATNGAWSADFNGDGNVDGGDLALWQQHYSPLGISGLSVSGLSATVGGMAEMTAVPEPATAGLVVAGMASLGLLARRRRAE